MFCIYGFFFKVKYIIFVYVLLVKVRYMIIVNFKIYWGNVKLLYI